MLLMHNRKHSNFDNTTHEVDKMCGYFLRPRGFSYFQFKRTYKCDSFIILANHLNFLNDFLEKDFIEPSFSTPVYTRQSPIYFWDESLSPSVVSSMIEKKNIYHGITIISRRKNFYDCTSFAMSMPHPSPFSYYFHVLKELQKFAEIFPTIARTLIEKASRQQPKILAHKQSLKRKSFLLPERSARFRIGGGLNNYITTYEALCLQLFQEGKSYKEIGSVLSMAPRTVETHLSRLKSRTGLTLQELSLQSFQADGNRKNIFNLNFPTESTSLTTKGPTKADTRRSSTKTKKDGI